MVFALQQELLEKDEKMLELEKSNQTLKLQLQNATSALKQTKSTVQNQTQGLNETITQLNTNFKILEEKYGNDKLIWQQKYEMLERDTTEEIGKFKEMCKAYKLNVSELQNQLELEEQTVQVHCHCLEL